LRSQPVTIENYSAHPARLSFELASTGFSSSVFRQFANLADSADIIHYHFPWPFMDLVHFATRVSKPTVVTYHSDIIRQRLALQFYRPLRSLFLGNVSRIVATSANYFATSKILQHYKSKTSVIPIGLDRSTYSRPSDAVSESLRERFGNRFFLFVGVLRYYKGLHILLDAIAHTDLSVVIVGAGPIEQDLREQAVRLKLSNVFFLGAVSDEEKAALLTLCFAVVFPSHLRSEAFGISLLEGAMFGKPMISSEIGTGTSFVNIDGETGLVVPPSDPDALRRAMAYLSNIRSRPNEWVKTHDCVMRNCSRPISWCRNILISTTRCWPRPEAGDTHADRRRVRERFTFRDDTNRRFSHCRV
jgi:glycosyltransferase involved in cell wall biosynthesis